VLAIPFPYIDPIIFEIGPLAIRWYALTWIIGLFAGAWYMRRVVVKPPALMTPLQVDDFFLWVMLGAILGGRLGYVLFYKPAEYFANPITILQTWNGGMSFHGGLLGVILGIMIIAHRNKIDQGRVAPDIPWAMVFPNAGDIPRHPSQLYQAFLEGPVLFGILYWLARNEMTRRKTGTLTGVFLIGYGVFRVSDEFFREPDAHLGFLIGGATMGQLLSIPMVLFGIYCVWRAQTVARKA
jgi:phosphatidylglycerol:prolipoprotein diacylglycerol transferase